MKLSKIIQEIDVIEIVGKTDIEISEIVIDSKSVVINSLFVCLSGQKFDGHDFLAQAVQSGAEALCIAENAREKLPEKSRISSFFKQ